MKIVLYGCPPNCHQKASCLSHGCVATNGDIRRQLLWMAKFLIVQIIHFYGKKGVLHHSISRFLFETWERDQQFSKIAECYGQNCVISQVHISFYEGVLGATEPLTKTARHACSLNHGGPESTAEGGFSAHKLSQVSNGHLFKDR